MAILKCKMCGGDLTIEKEQTVCECEYCGTRQTVPKVDNEKKITLYERANRLRYNCEFDKAQMVYESIVAEFPGEAESYWGLVLCKYGIEYVDDPATGKKIPTCHRLSFDSVMDDADFEMVMENADTISRQVYREQAKQIEEIRKRIIEISGKEEPYDIFICYKETSEDGQRTIDSVLAQDVYDALTAKGYRVFFSRITLEDKLGTEYEPYIFAALNSARIMLAFGTTYDYYNAVWVKNEWSRYLKLMAKDKNKHLIPCYKDIDAYDMPKEFARFQAQDIGKVGAMQDLIRGIDKIFNADVNGVQSSVQNEAVNMDDIKAAVTSAVSNNSLNNVDKMLSRGFIALEDEEWDKADEFFEDALNQDVQNAQAYLGKLMAECKVSNMEKLTEYYKNKYLTFEDSVIEVCSKEEIVDARISVSKFEQYDLLDKIENRYISKLPSVKKNYEEFVNDKLLKRVRRYAMGDIKESIEQMVAEITQVLDENIRKLSIVDGRKNDLIIEKCEKAYAEAKNAFDTAHNIEEFRHASALLSSLPDYKDAIELWNRCSKIEVDYYESEKVSQEKWDSFCNRLTPIIVIIVIFLFLYFLGSLDV